MHRSKQQASGMTHSFLPGKGMCPILRRPPGDSWCAAQDTDISSMLAGGPSTTATSEHTSTTCPTRLLVLLLLGPWCRPCMSAGHCTSCPVSAMPHLEALAAAAPAPDPAPPAPAAG